MTPRITFDPNGGELCRSYMGVVTPMEFVALVPHVANILQALYESKHQRLPYHYAFEVRTTDRQLVELLFNVINLPPNVQWYICDKTRLFELRGASGGVVTSMICYLHTTVDPTQIG